MKKLSFISVLTIISLGYLPKLSAQEIISEVFHPAGQTSFQHHQSKQLNSEYDLKSETNGIKIYQKSIDLGNTSTDGVNETVSLQVNLIYPSGAYSPNFVVVFQENENSQSEMMSGSNSITFEVNPGVYDIIVQSLKMADRKFSYSFKELITVNEDLVVNIDLTEADNLITTHFLDENGNNLKPGIYNPDTSETEGGTANVYGTTYLYYKSKNWTPFINYFLWENSEGIENEVWNYYVSDLSDRYAFIHTNLGIGYNGEGYISKYETLSEGINSTLTLENNPNDWVTHEQKFQPSLLGNSQNEFYYGFSNWDTYNGYGLSGWIGRLFSDTTDLNQALKFHLNNADDENPVDILLNPVLREYVGTIDPWMEDEFFHIVGNSIMLNENRQIVYGPSTFLSGYYYNGYIYHTDEIGVKLLPFHPKFSFEFNAQNPIIFGKTVPHSVTSYDGYFPRVSYIGRNGEGRESDLFATEVLVKREGAIVFEGNYADFLWMEPLEWGELEINFTNTNMEVDEIQGKTETLLNFNASGSDNVPPTVQMLQFRNENGKITERFGSDEVGTLRLAAGDFEYVPETRSLQYKAGNSVELFYRPNGENDWIELPLTHYPEHLVPIAFGDYYEGSLEEITANHENALFDVKIICTDIAGNKQEQIISPAFQLNSTLKLSEENNGNLVVYPNPFSNQIHLLLPENMQGKTNLRLFDLNGKIILKQDLLIDKNHHNLNLDYLPKGIYVLTLEDGKSQISTKIIKN
jgi:hypothetical protein